MRCLGKNTGLIRAAVVVYVITIVVIVSVIVHNHMDAGNAFVRHFARATAGLLSAACVLTVLLPAWYKLAHQRCQTINYIFVALAHVACVSTLISACVLSSAIIAVGDYTPAQLNLASVNIAFHWALLLMFMNDYTTVSIFAETVAMIPGIKRCLPEDYEKMLKSQISPVHETFWGLPANDVVASTITSERHTAAARAIITRLQQQYNLAV